MHQEEIDLHLQPNWKCCDGKAAAHTLVSTSSPFIEPVLQSYSISQGKLRLRYTLETIPLTFPISTLAPYIFVFMPQTETLYPYFLNFHFYLFFLTCEVSFPQDRLYNCFCWSTGAQTQNILSLLAETIWNQYLKQSSV